MPQPQFTVPILLVVFNRPETTRRVFDEIRKQKPASLFIAADGPRPNRPDDATKCAEVRKIVSDIDWPCEVKTLFREKNLGFIQAEKLAFDWFFENVEEGIILEDDQLPHPSFFRFAAEMLKRYRDDEYISMITGDNFLSDLKIENSYFYSRFFPIWGWATWRRVWRQYDFNMTSWKDRKNKMRIQSMYPLSYVWNRMKKSFDEVYAHKNTWDSQWLYTCLMTGGYCIVPSVNLISNIGIEGTHSQGHNQNLPTHDLYANGPLRHPESISENTQYDITFYERNFKEPDWTTWERLRRFIISILVRYAWIKRLYRLFKPKKPVR